MEIRGCPKSNAQVVQIQNVLLCEIKFTTLQYNPFLVLYTSANHLEVFGFHSGVILY